MGSVDDEPAKLSEVISIRHLWAAYNGEPVLEDINLSVKQLDFIGLIGPNGSGKSTLFKVLLGLLRPLRGEVRIMGLSVQQGRRYIGYVPQSVEFDRAFPITVWDVVMLGRLGKRRLMQNYTSKDRSCVVEALKSVNMLDFRDRSLSELSVGQRKRIYIARALATEPQILLLDEPLAGIDPHAGDRIYDLFKQLNERIAILMISHDIGAISSCVKSIGCLNHKLFYHGDNQITPEMLELAYQCPIDLIAHGIPHRVFAPHQPQEADLLSYLFGSILTVSSNDLLVMFVLDAIVIALVILFYKELLAISFDEIFATIANVPVDAIYLTLMCTIALTVVMLMRVVGLIMTIALLTMPAAISRLFVKDIKKMMVLASCLGGLFTTIGLWLSYFLNLTSGATIILVSGIAYLLSVGIQPLLKARKSATIQSPRSRSIT
jgi:zinc transport system ATP-binding protein